MANHDIFIERNERRKHIYKAGMNPITRRKAKEWLAESIVRVEREVT